MSNIASFTNENISQNSKHVILFMCRAAGHVHIWLSRLKTESLDLREFYQPANKFSLNKEQLNEKMKV